ncbi:MAG: hypothetical protein J5523_08485 [Muribaculaceae bacterium]|nr:hypothetical protein [Muribaculaceae bacterium]
MKPITNILLIAALICYFFLPLCELQVKGDVTGLAYSAAMITENFSLKRTVFALLPFIACFGGIVFNCMKNRYWGIVVAAFVGMGIFFFTTHHVFLNAGLQHAPDVIANDELEGFGIAHLGIGYKVCRWLMYAALASALISLLPFKFNTILERSIDETFEKGIQGSKKKLSKVGHDIHDEWNKLENAHKNKKKTPPAKETPSESSEVSENSESPEKKPLDENPHARFMPPQPEAEQPELPKEQ